MKSNFFIGTKSVYTQAHTLLTYLTRGGGSKKKKKENMYHLKETFGECGQYRKSRGRYPGSSVPISILIFHNHMFLSGV